MVRIDADDVVSVRNVLKRQYGSPSRHGYASQIVYSSGGRPSQRNVAPAYGSRLEVRIPTYWVHTSCRLKRHMDGFNEFVGLRVLVDRQTYIQTNELSATQRQTKLAV